MTLFWIILTLIFYVLLSLILIFFLFNRDIELLALFVACLCHDIDHRGTTNSFQVSSVSISSKWVQTKCFWFVCLYFSFLFFRSVLTGFDSRCLIQLEGIGFGGMSDDTHLLKPLNNRKCICFCLSHLPQDSIWYDCCRIKSNFKVAGFCRLHF